MLTKLISCLSIQLEKISLVKKTEINPDKVIIYLEEVRRQPQGAAHSSSSNCSTSCYESQRSKIQISRLIKQAKILAKEEEGGRTWKDREEISDAKGIKLVCR